MTEALVYLDGNDNVSRYSWFSARTTRLENVNLLNNTGELTRLGLLYSTVISDMPSVSNFSQLFSSSNESSLISFISDSFPSSASRSDSYNQDNSSNIDDLIFSTSSGNRSSSYSFSSSSDKYNYSSSQAKSSSGITIFPEHWSLFAIVMVVATAVLLMLGMLVVLIVITISTTRQDNNSNKL